MIKHRKLTRHEKGWPEGAVVLARAAHAIRFEALQSLRVALHDERFQEWYERMFSMLEAILDNEPQHKLIPEALEHLVRTRCDPADPDAAWDVAVHSARSGLAACFSKWRQEA